MSQDSFSDPDHFIKKYPALFQEKVVTIPFPSNELTEIISKVAYKKQPESIDKPIQKEKIPSGWGEGVKIDTSHVATSSPIYESHSEYAVGTASIEACPPSAYVDYSRLDYSKLDYAHKDGVVISLIKRDSGNPVWLATYKYKDGSASLVLDVTTVIPKLVNEPERYYAYGVEFIDKLRELVCQTLGIFAEQQDRGELIKVNSKMCSLMFRNFIMFLTSKYTNSEGNWISDEKRKLYDSLYKYVHGGLLGPLSREFAYIPAAELKYLTAFEVEGEETELEPKKIYWVVCKPDEPEAAHILTFRHKSSTDYWFTNKYKKIMRIPIGDRNYRYFSLKES